MSEHAISVDELRSVFAQSLVARRLSPSTIKIYLDSLDRFLACHEGIDVRAVSRRDIDAYYAQLASEPLSASTRSQRMRGLKRFFGFLVDSQRLFASPMDHFHERRIHIPLGRTLSEAEVDRLLAAPNTSLPGGIRDRALLELLYATGLRRQELLSLEVFDIDLAGALVHVRAGKGGKDRFVPFSSHAQRWLTEYLHHVRPRLARFASVESRILFLGRSGQPMAPESLAQLLLRHGTAARLGRISSHMIRRTVATALLRGGADVVTVAKLLGHEHLVTTQRYAQLTAADVRAAHARTHPRGDDSQAR